MAGSKTATPAKVATPAQSGGQSTADVIQKAVSQYWSTTPGKLKAIDSFLAYVMLVGIIQFVYCVIVGPYPFNSFLAGFLSCIGVFVLTVGLRMQAKENNPDFPESPPKRALADYLFCNFILLLWVWNFMG